MVIEIIGSYYCINSDQSWRFLVPSYTFFIENLNSKGKVTSVSNYPGTLYLSQTKQVSICMGSVYKEKIVQGFILYYYQVFKLHVAVRFIS